MRPNIRPALPWLIVATGLIGTAFSNQYTWILSSYIAAGLAVRIENSMRFAFARPEYTKANAGALGVAITVIVISLWPLHQLLERVSIRAIEQRQGGRYHVFLSGKPSGHDGLGEFVASPAEAATLARRWAGEFAPLPPPAIMIDTRYSEFADNSWRPTMYLLESNNSWVRARDAEAKYREEFMTDLKQSITSRHNNK